MTAANSQSSQREVSHTVYTNTPTSTSLPYVVLYAKIVLNARRITAA